MCSILERKMSNDTSLTQVSATKKVDTHLSFFVIVELKVLNAVVKKGTPMDFHSSNVVVTFIYDNQKMDPLLQEGWGLSLLVEYEDKKILFDTGGSPEAFSRNIEKLNIHLNEITHLVVSHRHWDHRAGLEKVLARLSETTKIFLPKYFRSPFLKWKFKSLAFTRSTSLMEIGNNLYSLTLRAGFLLHEQTLIVSTSKGLVLITGCAHPGIKKIITETKKLFPTTSICCVMGGLHLFNSTPLITKEIVQFFLSSGIEKVAPCHCTGDAVIHQFRESYKNNFIEVGTGAKICI
jgi:7,8-dihydropterin-6-yl-methyl-4-(beta-D-ribofuranosyl)aminobenzene 5'-phosphate synthase